MNALTPQLFQEALHSQKRVFAWGVAAILPYVIQQYGFIFAGIIDGQLQDESAESTGLRYGLNVYSPTVLKEYNSNEVIIIVVADIRQFGVAISKQIEALGDYTFCYLDKPVQQLLSSVSIPDFTFAPNTTGDDLAAPDCVCLCIPSLSFGGAERQMYLVAKGFVQLGYRVHLITWTPSRPSARPETTAGPPSRSFTPPAWPSPAATPRPRSPSSAAPSPWPNTPPTPHRPSAPSWSRRSARPACSWPRSPPRRASSAPDATSTPPSRSCPRTTR